MVVDVKKHAESCSAVGTLVLPEWPSAFFWPLLKPKISRFAPFIRDVRYLPRRPDLIIPGPGRKHTTRVFLWLYKVPRDSVENRFQLTKF